MCVWSVGGNTPFGEGIMDTGWYVFTLLAVCFVDSRLFAHSGRIDCLTVHSITALCGQLKDSGVHVMDCMCVVYEQTLCKLFT